MSDNRIMTAQTWNPAEYARNGRFVAQLSSAVIDLLAPGQGEHILDLGCGDGVLTEQLAATGAQVTGVDASPEMVVAARARGLHIDHHAAQSLPYEDRFDAVFSNAALHWIPAADQPEALAAIHRALKSGGRFVAEMGGQGNIAAIRIALSAVLARHDRNAEALAASFFPAPPRYQALLEAAGFTVQTISLHPRPTPLPAGSEGMHRWLETFRSGVLNQLPEPVRTQAVSETITLLKPILHDPQTDTWTADYVRLRFHATRR